MRHSCLKFLNIREKPLYRSRCVGKNNESLLRLPVLGFVNFYSLSRGLKKK
jgi:hypothetical protein